MADAGGELRSGDLLAGWLSLLMALVWAASPAALAMLAPGWKLLALLGGSCIDSFRLDNVELRKDVESVGLGLFVGGSGMGMKWGNGVNCTWRWKKKGGSASGLWRWRREMEACKWY